jgi:hypothetical protein
MTVSNMALPKYVTLVKMTFAKMMLVQRTFAGRSFVEMAFVKMAFVEMTFVEMTFVEMAFVEMTFVEMTQKVAESCNGCFGASFPSSNWTKSQRISRLKNHSLNRPRKSFFFHYCHFSSLPSPGLPDGIGSNQKYQFG